MLILFLGWILAGVASATELPDLMKPLRSGERAAGDVAVVIGIESYPFASDVPYAARDAQAMYTWLLHTRGISQDRIRLLDGGASREDMIEASTWAGELAGPDATVWFTFAGHGAADPSTGERVLLGDDVRRQASSITHRGVAVSELRRAAGAGGAEVFMLVDACYAGVGRDGEELLAGTRFLVPVAEVNPEMRGIEWSAAGPNQLTGPLEPAEHGAFTYFAIGAMRGWADGFLDGSPDGQVTADEARAYVNHALRVAGVDDQHSQIVAPDPSRVVLAKSSRFEEAPDLEVLQRANTPRRIGPQRPSVAGEGLDPTDRRALVEWASELVDTCYARHAEGTFGIRQWRVAFRIHPERGLRMVRVRTQINLITNFYRARRRATRLCIRDEIRDAEFAVPASVVKFSTNLRANVSSESGAERMVPDSIPLPLLGGFL
ncbi:MAG: hypothetical protein EA397_01090 [Deltaproteobacteria bacterium]|nr:MAG: hypothetical protein EA397_01090 [Deltaproteobacteria bacterium]